VVIELPPWTMVAYPSSLLYHFNIDITGKRSFVVAIFGADIGTGRLQVCNN
jgi:hypothetical protein